MLVDLIKKLKNGVIRNPPPTPKSPESRPTIKLRKSIKKMSTDTPAIGR